MSKVLLNQYCSSGEISALTNLSLDNCFFENIKKLAIFVLDKQGHLDDCASINFVSKEEIHKLNKKYRDIDKPTDVLSFEAEDIDGDLGDIFICADVAYENSQKFNTSLNSELELLIVHGMLHLCGYDHISDDEAKIMENKEEEILDAWEQK